MLRNEKLAVLVGRELAAQVHVGLGRVLVLVEAFGRGLPDVDLGVGDRLAVAVVDLDVARTAPAPASASG